MIAKSQAKIAGADFGNRELGLLNSKVDSKIFGSKSKICFTRSWRFEKLRIRLLTKAAQMEPVQSQNVDVGRRSKSVSTIILLLNSVFVAFPL